MFTGKKRKMKREVFSDSYTEETASATNYRFPFRMLSFEVSYLEDGLGDFGDTLFLSILKLFQTKATSIIVAAPL